MCLSCCFLRMELIMINVLLFMTRHLINVTSVGLHALWFSSVSEEELSVRPRNCIFMCELNKTMTAIILINVSVLSVLIWGAVH